MNSNEKTGGLWICDSDGNCRTLLDILKEQWPDEWAEIQKEDAEEDNETG